MDKSKGRRQDLDRPPAQRCKMLPSNECLNGELHAGHVKSHQEGSSVGIDEAEVRLLVN